MSLRAIAYTSEVAAGMSFDTVEDLVRKAAIFNANAGVTGLLLFDGARFLQYLEGPDDGLSVVYSKIMNSKSHTNLVELGRATTGRRYFPFWSMRLLPADPQDIRTSIRKDWSAFVMRRTVSDSATNYGVEQLARVALPHLAQETL